MSDMKDRVMQVILAEADVKKGFIPDHAKNKFSDNSGNLKCPFCQQELEKRHAATTDYNSMFITYYCANTDCESTTDLIGCKEFWDMLGQLIRTRKALDVAVDALNNIKKNCTTMIETESVCRYTLEQINEITELEQKDNGGNK